MQIKVKNDMIEPGDKMKDRKTKLLVTLSAIIALILIIVSVFFFFFKDKPGSTNDPDLPPDPSTSQIKCDMVSYEVFDLSELNFKFVLVNVRIKNDIPINASLNSFTSSEGLNLNDVNDYISELAENSVFLGKAGVDFDLESDENSAVFTLFVPLLQRSASTISLFYQDENVADIDLTLNVTGTPEKIGLIKNKQLSDDRTFNVTVNMAIDISGEALYQNNELTTYPSTAQLMAFKLTLTSIDGQQVVIEEAEYITEANSDTFIALDQSYEKTEKRRNIINIKTTSSTNGYLFFMTLNPDRVEITYTGILRVKINGQWSSVEIKL